MCPTPDYLQFTASLQDCAMCMQLNPLQCRLQQSGEEPLIGGVMDARRLFSTVVCSVQCAAGRPEPGPTVQQGGLSRPRAPVTPFPTKRCTITLVAFLCLFSSVGSQMVFGRGKFCWCSPACKPLSSLPPFPAKASWAPGRTLR